MPLKCNLTYFIHSEAPSGFQPLSPWTDSYQDSIAHSTSVRALSRIFPARIRLERPYSDDPPPNFLEVSNSDVVGHL